MTFGPSDILKVQVTGWGSAESIQVPNFGTQVATRVDVSTLDVIRGSAVASFFVAGSVDASGQSSDGPLMPGPLYVFLGNVGPNKVLSAGTLFWVNEGKVFDGLRYRNGVPVQHFAQELTQALAVPSQSQCPP